MRLAASMRKYKFDGPVTSESLAAALSDGITEILEPVAAPIAARDDAKPHVILLVGVNGSKTTTAGQTCPAMAGRGQKRDAGCR